MSGDVFAWLAEHSPTLGILVVAIWTAWKVSAWRATSDHQVDEVKRRLEEHERGCEERGKQVNARLSRIERDVSFIRGQVAPRE